MIGHHHIRPIGIDVLLPVHFEPGARHDQPHPAPTSDDPVDRRAGSVEQCDNKEHGDGQNGGQDSCDDCEDGAGNVDEPAH